MESKAESVDNKLQQEISNISTELKNKHVEEHSRPDLENVEEEEDDTTCMICMDGTVYEDNEIIFCEKCNIPVHQFCYGVDVIPEGDWFCNVCCNGNDPQNTVCELCPYKGGAYQKTVDGNWVHVLCANWIPEVYLPSMQKGYVLSKVDKDRFKLKCEICHGKGAKIQCAYGRCNKSAHPWCVLNNKKSGYTHRVVKSVDVEGIMNWEIFCTAHADQVSAPVKPKVKAKQIVVMSLDENDQQKEDSIKKSQKGARKTESSKKKKKKRHDSSSEDEMLYYDYDDESDFENERPLTVANSLSKGLGSDEFSMKIEHQVPQVPSLSEWPGQSEGEPLDLYHFWNVVELSFPEVNRPEWFSEIMTPDKSINEHFGDLTCEYMPIGNAEETIKKLLAGDESVLTPVCSTDREIAFLRDYAKTKQLYDQSKSITYQLQGLTYESRFLGDFDQYDTSKSMVDSIEVIDPGFQSTKEYYINNHRESSTQPPTKTNIKVIFDSDKRVACEYLVSPCNSTSHGPSFVPLKCSNSTDVYNKCGIIGADPQMPINNLDDTVCVDMIDKTNYSDNLRAKLIDKDIIAKDEDNEIARVIRLSQQSLRDLYSQIFSNIVNLNDVYMKDMKDKADEYRNRRLSYDTTYNNYLKQRTLKRTTMSLLRGVRDQGKDFNIQMKESLPASWTVEVNGRIHMKDDDEYPEDAVCMCCFDGASYEGNKILFCDGCNATMHQACYGVEEIPEGDFYCDRCQCIQNHYSVGKLPPNVNYKSYIRCALCPLLHGGLKRCIDGSWVHISCLNFCKGARVSDVTHMINIDISNVPKEKVAVNTNSSTSRAGNVSNTPQTLQPRDGQIASKDTSVKPETTNAVIDAKTENIGKLPPATSISTSTFKSEVQSSTAREEPQKDTNDSTFPTAYHNEDTGVPKKLFSDDTQLNSLEVTENNALKNGNLIPSEQFQYEEPVIKERQIQLMQSQVDQLLNPPLKKDSKSKEGQTQGLLLDAASKVDLSMSIQTTNVNALSTSLPSISAVLDTPNIKVQVSNSKNLNTPSSNLSKAHSEKGTGVSKQFNVCTLCNRKDGHVTRCPAPGCLCLYHPLCAWFDGLYFESVCIDASFLGHSSNIFPPHVDISIICRIHAPPDRVEQRGLRMKYRISEQDLIVLPGSRHIKRKKNKRKAGAEGESLRVTTSASIDAPVKDLNRDAYSQSICAACMQPTNNLLQLQNERNELLLCIDCKIIIHQACAGREKGSFLDNGAWRCPTCTRNIVPKCFVCPRVGGMFDMSVDGKWCHVFCLTHRPPTQKPKLSLTGEIIPKALQPKKPGCCYCNRKSGLLGQCQFIGCNKTFHPLCSARKGEDLIRIHNGAKEIMCAQHLPRFVCKLTSGHWVDINDIKKMKKMLDNARVIADLLIRREKLKKNINKAEANKFESKLRTQLELHPTVKKMTTSELILGMDEVFAVDDEEFVVESPVKGRPRKRKNTEVKEKPTEFFDLRSNVVEENQVRINRVLVAGSIKTHIVKSNVQRQFENLTRCIFGSNRDASDFFYNLGEIIDAYAGNNIQNLERAYEFKEILPAKIGLVESSVEPAQKKFKQTKGPKQIVIPELQNVQSKFLTIVQNQGSLLSPFLLTLGNKFVVQNDWKLLDSSDIMFYSFERRLSFILSFLTDFQIPEKGLPINSPSATEAFIREMKIKIAGSGINAYIEQATNKYQGGMRDRASSYSKKSKSTSNQVQLRLLADKFTDIPEEERLDYDKYVKTTITLKIMRSKVAESFYQSFASFECDFNHMLANGKYITSQQQLANGKYITSQQQHSETCWDARVLAALFDLLKEVSSDPGFDKNQFRQIQPTVSIIQNSAVNSAEVKSLSPSSTESSKQCLANEFAELQCGLCLNKLKVAGWPIVTDSTEENNEGVTEGKETKRKRPLKSKEKELKPLVWVCPHCLSDSSSRLLKSSIKVWWKDDNSYYTGKIVALDTFSGEYKILYEDGESEFLQLSSEAFYIDYATINNQ